MRQLPPADRQPWLDALAALCDQIAPRTILEFGSGFSTAILARYGPVTAIEYQPPGDWCGVGDIPGVDFRYVQWEDGLVPHRLVEAVFGLVLDRHRLALAADRPGATDPHPEHPVSMADWWLMSETRLVRPYWDLAFIDGAVHNRLGGYNHGDTGYLARMLLVGVLSAVCRYVIVDDVDCLRSIPRTRVLDVREGRLALIECGPPPTQVG